MEKTSAKFTASARTVEMLGRQQIAGIPNAISELFKNAYDAYADRAVVDHYIPQRLMTLRDNGLGMTREDVERRWLVLGTDSKAAGGSAGLAEVAGKLGLELRNTVGEKGIGRLAIAVIGPQVLLLSRAKRPDESCGAVAAFVNWSLFELPGVSLDEIEVPIREFDEGVLPDDAIVVGMVEQVRQNLKNLESRLDKQTVKEINGQLDTFAINPAGYQARYGESSLLKDGHGTQFYIHPVDDLLQESLNEREQSVAGRMSRSKLRNMLVGFTNTMVDEGNRPEIETEFYYYPTFDRRVAVVNREEFFTPEEFAAADHHISGRFDENGQFVGLVSVYGQETNNHVIPWPAGGGRETECGPFYLQLAYVQGQRSETRMQLEEWQELNRKLQQMGGLYIYRNGIRILPYGDPDVDFLGFEERRSLRAATYFFSYRRMFGTIELSPERKYKLNEKAGREGFMENRAFRQFRDILENFFTQLAADFFQDESPIGTFRSERAELSRRAKAELLRESTAAPERARFARALRNLRNDLDEGVLETRASSVIEELRSALLVAETMPGPEARADAAVDAGLNAARELENLRAKYRTPEVEGFGASQSLRRELNDYDAVFNKQDADVLESASLVVEDLLWGPASPLLGYSDSRRFLRDSIRRLGEKTAISVQDTEKAANSGIFEAGQRAFEAVHQHATDFNDVLEEIISDLEGRVDDIPNRGIADYSHTLKAKITGLAESKIRIIDDIKRQFAVINVVPDADGMVVSESDMANAIEENLDFLRQDLIRDSEYVQLGMTVGIIDHELQAVIGSLRNNISRLRTWAVRNEGLVDIYQGIRVNFDHLDSYLRLLTPLQRRSRRTLSEIKCSALFDFIEDLFATRLEREEMTLERTPAFKAYSFVSYPSTFYPVFVNLVDNATFWLQHKESDRRIWFDVEGQTLIVGDNGPGVPHRDREAVFEPGFTRKPGGMGLGLYIARNELRRVGYHLVISDPPTGEGTEFRIVPMENSNG